MIVTDISPTGKLVLQEKQAVIIGLSIRNNYFRGDTIEQITNWAKDNFCTLVFMLPDEPAIDTLTALGYSAEKAKQKAMLACNNLENKCRRIIDKFNIGTMAQIVRWAKLQHNPAYQESYSKLSQLYNEDELFRLDIKQSTRQMMERHKTKLPIEEAVAIGGQFLIKELSFITAASEILSLNCASAYLYHRQFDVHRNLLAGRYKMPIPANNGYIIGEVSYTAFTD
jgi:tRNA-dependent cyclodipeptide synthase